MYADTVRRELRNRRKQRSLSRTQLAQLADLSYEAIAALENARVDEPKISTLLALARALRCTVMELIGEAPDSARQTKARRSGLGKRRAPEKGYLHRMTEG